MTRERKRMVSPYLDTKCMDEIAAILSGHEWDADTCARIAEWVTYSRREVCDVFPDDSADENIRGEN